MTPIETMTRILWPDLYDDPSKGAFYRAAAHTVEAARARPEAEKRVRAALLALAEVELPEKALAAGLDDLHDGIDGIGHIVEPSSMGVAFRTMLRSLAEGGEG